MTTKQAQAPAPTGRTVRTVTRQQIVELGQAGMPWDFLPLGLQVLRATPQDLGMGMLVAANFARLGLVTAAREHLATLPPASAAEPSVAQLAAALRRLPCDVVAPALRLATCRANVEALLERGLDLRATLEEWSHGVAERECFEANDGNVVQRAAGAQAPWIGLTNQVGAAEQFVLKHVTETDETYKPPQVIEGINPPWLLLQLAQHTPPTINGYQPSITVLQADPMELLEGLSIADLRAVIREPRVTFFVGPAAGERFRAHLYERFETKIQGPFVGLPGIRTPIQPPAPDILHAAQTDQQTEADRLHERVSSLYAKRDRAFWARRYAEARNGSGPPLRVLIPTTRFSTFVQHASRDLAAAFAEIGCEVEVMLEPDAFTRFSSVAYLSRFERCEPDLVVLINYTRANLGGLLPLRVPFVCWLQDAMWHQFDEKVGGAQTEMDFLAGHLFEELFERFGYPKRNTLSMPVVASTAKFHDSPQDRALVERHACDIAYVGHQSETPDDQRRRIIDELSHSRVLQRCLESMHPKIVEIASHPTQRSPGNRLATLVDETLQTVVGSTDPRAAAHLLQLCVLPMADRIIRHQSLAWAAEVADRRGWRFNLYGRGWDAHPRLASYACGELPHGEDLRASYQAASVHLHLTINTIRHQRLLECVLSGGLPVCRRKCDDLAPMRDYTHNRLVRDQEPVVVCTTTRRLGYAIADHPDAMSFIAACERYGMTPCQFMYLSAEEIECRRSDEHPFLDRVDAWLLGDPAEITFDSPCDLEQIVDRAVERPTWRDNVSRSIARRVRERYTTEHFAQRVIDMVRNSFS